MTTTRPIDVVIVEDEPHLAELHREYIEQNFHLRLSASPLRWSRPAADSRSISRG
jgi:response regulator of citrate/malate metabolism